MLLAWLLDTRPLWPTASCAADLPLDSVLGVTERARVARYAHLGAAKTALASLLLQRAALAALTGECAAPALSPTGKPCVPGASGSAVGFNVSHQAGVVILVGVRLGRRTDTPVNVGVDVGVDLVCPAERAALDRAQVRECGWDGFVRVFAPALGRRDAVRLAAWPHHSPTNSTAELTAELTEDLTHRRLAAFYSLWCLREAYLKMTGAALAAPWLAELDFVRFGPPPPVRTERDVGVVRRSASASADPNPNPNYNHNHQQEGQEQEEERDLVLRLHWLGAEVLQHAADATDANTNKNKNLDEYMACTCIRITGPDADEAARLRARVGAHLGRFRVVSFDEVVAVARGEPVPPDMVVVHV